MFMIRRRNTAAGVRYLEEDLHLDAKSFDSQNRHHVTMRRQAD